MASWAKEHWILTFFIAMGILFTVRFALNPTAATAGGLIEGGKASA